MGNRSVFKRLGYLLEVSEVTAPILVKACTKGISSGISLLDPSLPYKGSVLKRWNLVINATLKNEDERS